VLPILALEVQSVYLVCSRAVVETAYYDHRVLSHTSSVLVKTLWDVNVLGMVSLDYVPSERVHVERVKVIVAVEVVTAAEEIHHFAKHHRRVVRQRA
jgi:hypothetical protein